MEPEKIHDLLIETGLPSTLVDLKNPTKEYVINLLTQFLNRLYIDVAAIKRPTMEQLSSVSLAEDNAEIISMINLSEAMAGICDQIYFKDYCLTVLTNPTSKKTRRLAQVLSNFLLYTLNKESELEECLAEMREKRQRLEEIEREKDKYLNLQSQKALEIAKKIELKEQLEAEVARIRSLKGTKKAKTEELQEKLKAAEKEKREISQHHGMLTAEALRMRKITDDLESKLVKAPERFESRLKELLEQKKNQMEKREVMQEAMSSKKPAIERIQSHLSVVSNAHAKYREAIETSKLLENSTKKLEETNKKLEEMKLLVERETAASTHGNTEATNAVLQKTKEQCDQHLSSVRKTLNRLLNVKMGLERKLLNDQKRQQELFSELNELRASIGRVETETAKFITDCQELYDNEINEQRKLKRSLDKAES